MPDDRSSPPPLSCATTREDLPSSWTHHDLPLRAAELEARLGSRPAVEVLAFALRDAALGRVALVTSFGAEAAVLLHMAATIDRDTPILFIDTNRHFSETLWYRDHLSAHLGLRRVLTIGPSPCEEAKFDPGGSLACVDPDACCTFRKTAPLRRALTGFDVWISGRRRSQSSTRERMKIFEADDRWLKVNPLADWDSDAVASYFARHGLPVHPLVARGYPSIGCAPCTSAVGPGENPRAGRWRGSAKTECGIHQ